MAIYLRWGPAVRGLSFLTIGLLVPAAHLTRAGEREAFLKQEIRRLHYTQILCQDPDLKNALELKIVLAIIEGAVTAIAWGGENYSKCKANVSSICSCFYSLKGKCEIAGVLQPPEL